MIFETNDKHKVFNTRQFLNTSILKHLRN